MNEALKDAGKAFLISAVAGAGLMTGAAGLIAITNLAGTAVRAVINLF